MSYITSTRFSRGRSVFRSRIFRWSRGTLLAATLMLLCSCSVYDDDEVSFEGVIDFLSFSGSLLWMAITKPREMTLEEMQEMFAEHRDMMTSIVQACEEYPRINRIYADYPEGDQYYSEDEIGLELTTVVEAVRSSLAEIPALQVICWREHNVEGNPLSIVSFVVDTLKSIDYRTEWFQKSRPLTWEQLERQGYIEMLGEGWFIHRW